MGDNVNLGARLEGINKLYGSNIIASEATVELARELIVVRELDLVRVKGKAQTARIFEVLGPADSRRAMARAHRALPCRLAAYRAREWASAMAAFERAWRLGPATAHRSSTCGAARSTCGLRRRRTGNP